MQNHVCKYTHTLNAHVCMRILSRTACACRVACPGKEVRGRQHVSQQFQGQVYWITLQHLTWNFTCRVGEIIPSPAPQSIHVWRYMASQFAFICPKPVPIKPSVLLRKLNSAHISLKTHLQIIITWTHCTSKRCEHGSGLVWYSYHGFGETSRPVATCRISGTCD